MEVGMGSSRSFFMRGGEDREPFEPSGLPRMLKICLGAGAVGVVASAIIFFFFSGSDESQLNIRNPTTRGTESGETLDGRDDTSKAERER